MKVLAVSAAVFAVALSLAAAPAFAAGNGHSTNSGNNGAGTHMWVSTESAPINSSESPSGEVCPYYGGECPYYEEACPYYDASQDAARPQDGSGARRGGGQGGGRGNGYCRR